MKINVYLLRQCFICMFKQKLCNVNGFAIFNVIKGDMIYIFFLIQVPCLKNITQTRVPLFAACTLSIFTSPKKMTKWHI